MTSYINVHLQLTKDVLQAIVKDNAYIERYKQTEQILGDIYKNVQSNATYKKTKYIYNINQYWVSGQKNELLIDELTRKLKNEFTGCKIEYVETKGYDGSVIERIIVIDWS
jgi:hypothetical protein